MAFTEVEIWRWRQGISKVGYSACPMGATSWEDQCYLPKNAKPHRAPKVGPKVPTVDSL